MAQGVLAAVLRGLVEQAERLGTGIAGSLARFTDRTADIAEANLDRILRTDDDIAARMARAGRRPAALPTRDLSDVPLGFADTGAYNEFVGTLRHGLAGAGFTRTEAAFQGSSVTGVSYLSGQPFRPESDYDIALGGPDIFRRARELGVSVRSGGTRTGPLTPAQIDALGLGPMHARLHELAGRDVNFMIFDTIDRATDRRPSRLAVPVQIPARRAAP
jgi:hypothetical protein